MRKTVTSGLLTASTGLLIGAAHAAAGIQVPAAGTTLVYECDGTWSEEYVDTITRVEDGFIRIEGTNDGKPFWVEEPIFAFGLTLFAEKEGSSGRGRITQTWEIDNLEDLVDLRPGSTFGGFVTERHRDGKRTWRYDISVGNPETIDHPMRGRVKVIPVTEKRMTYQSSYSSVMTSTYEQESGLFVRWHYKDVDGEEICDLVEME